jgi:hypothetical protein
MWRCRRASLADNFTANCSSSAGQPITRATDGLTDVSLLCLLPHQPVGKEGRKIFWILLKGAFICFFPAFRDLCLFVGSEVASEHQSQIHHVDTKGSQGELVDTVSLLRGFLLNPFQTATTLKPDVDTAVLLLRNSTNAYISYQSSSHTKPYRPDHSIRITAHHSENLFLNPTSSPRLEPGKIFGLWPLVL